MLRRTLLFVAVTALGSTPTAADMPAPTSSAFRVPAPVGVPMGPAAAQADPPSVLLLATGGTISNTGGPRLTGEELVASLPGIEQVARLRVEQFANVASGAITLDQWLALARRIDVLFEEDPALAGIVVTHGTDTMEETAYFLDLTLAPCRPVVVTGAMRQATALGADGPANLFNAIRLAASAETREIGAVVLMNDEIFPAREVAKISTNRVDAFIATGGGRLGVTDSDALVLERTPRTRTCGVPAFSLEGVTALPRVEIVTSYLGGDGALVRAAVAAGARGIVMASVGQGGTTPDQRSAIQEAMEAGVTVVISSRTGSGRVPVQRGSGGFGAAGTPEATGTRADGESTGVAPNPSGVVLGADSLTPVKARILLMLALAEGAGPERLQEVFRTF
jgi:L-asparaginase